MSYTRTSETIRRMVESRRKNPKFQEHLARMNAARKGTKLSEEHKRKITEGLKGRVQSAETRAKIGAVHRGKIVSKETRIKMSKASKGVSKNVEENNPLWKGDKVKYRGLHQWVARHKVRRNICNNCDAQSKTHFANISGEYRRDLDDFMELCVSCHRRFDLARPKELA